MDSTTKITGLSLGTIFRNAWEQLKGNKWRFWQQLILLMVLAATIYWLKSYLFARTGLDETPYATSAITWNMVAGLMYYLFSAPIIAGIIAWALKRMRGQSAPENDEFISTRFWIPCFFVLAIQAGVKWGISMVVLHFSLSGGTLLTVLVFLGLLFFFNVFILVDTQCSPWRATVDSFSLVLRHFFKTLALFVVLTLVLMVGTLLLGIGLIWAMPFFYLAMAGFYLGISAGKDGHAVTAS